MSVLIPPSSAQLRGELNVTALTLPDDLTYDEWVEYGHQLDGQGKGANKWTWLKYLLSTSGSSTVGTSANADRLSSMTRHTRLIVRWLNTRSM